MQEIELLKKPDRFPKWEASSPNSGWLHAQTCKCLTRVGMFSSQNPKTVPDLSGSQRDPRPQGDTEGPACGDCSGARLRSPATSCGPQTSTGFSGVLVGVEASDTMSRLSLHRLWSAIVGNGDSASGFPFSGVPGTEFSGNMLSPPSLSPQHPFSSRFRA